MARADLREELDMSDPFGQLRTSRLTLVKESGERIENLRARFDTDKQQFKILAAGTDMDDGDTLIHHLPNGKDEEYRVLNSGYHQGFESLPDEYRPKVEKMTALRPSSVAPNVVYNVTQTGPNSRFNLDSEDLSVNVINVDSDQLFRDLRGAIARDVEDEDRQALLLRHVNELKKANGTPGYIEAYTSFMSTVADHMTIVAPFIPALSQLLQNIGG
jgi:hypothetical protein